MSAMTEEEARQRWCPFVRWDACGGESAPAANRHGSADHPTVTSVAAYRCIASNCMAWRWESKAKANGDRVRAVKERRETTGCSLMEAIAWVDANDRVATGAGYCGLAGAPTP